MTFIHHHTPPVLLAVAAHHDDNELNSGVLLAHRQAGWRVICAVVTDGCYIGGKIAPEHVARREAESRKAAAILDVECVFLRIAEGTTEPHETFLKTMVSQLRRWRPQIVITHPPVDYHRDHEWVSRLTREAVGCCWNPTVVTPEPPADVPNLYFCDAWYMPFEPDEYIDITPWIESKKRALECHRSQLASSRSDDAPDLVEMAMLRSRQRGIECGVAYAEAFRLCPRLGRQRLHGLLTAPMPGVEEPSPPPVVSAESGRD